MWESRGPAGPAAVSDPTGEGHEAGVPSICEPEVPAGVARATERVFAALSSARGRRIFHPQGIAFDGRLRVDAALPCVPLFAGGAVHDVVLRFSRALGTPRGRPDFLGLAVRIAGDQDLLLASSAAAPLLRFAPRPARTFAGTTLTSLLPLDAGGRSVLVAARVHHAPVAAEDQLAQLEAAAAVAPVGVAIAVAGPVSRWRRIATIDVGERLPAAEARKLAFDPFVSAGGLVPRGRINALRAPAYRGSRAGRAAPDLRRAGPAR
jgi:hypothetical protein